jgi:hypothetical protein
MCLSTLFTQPPDPEGEGWKWVEPYLTGEWRGPFFPVPYRRGRWIQAKEEKVSTYDDETYLSGYHIFINKADAEEFGKSGLDGCILVPVKYRGAKVWGKDESGFDTVVAQEIYFEAAAQESQ